MIHFIQNGRKHPLEVLVIVQILYNTAMYTILVPYVFPQILKTII